MSKKAIAAPASSLPEMDVEAASGPSDAQLKAVTRLAREQLDLQAEIETLNKKLDNLFGQLKANMEIHLPAAMDEAGIKETTLSNGATIEVATNVAASITIENRPKAHAWLEKTGNEALIKREITISFGRDEIKWATKFINDCNKRKKRLNLATKEWVDTNTLKAFVKRLRIEAIEKKKNPDEVVPASFSVYISRAAKVKVPKE